MSTHISKASARLDDPGQMAEFLAPIPDGERLALVLTGGAPVASRAYDDDTWTARFVDSDGLVVTCFTVTDITIDQAEMIAASCLDEHDIDLEQFSHAVELALGPTFEPDSKH